MRLVSVVNKSTDPDFSWNWVNQGIWATVESNFAIISGMKLRNFELCSPSNSPSLSSDAATGMGQSSQASSAREQISKPYITSVDHWLAQEA